MRYYQIGAYNGPVTILAPDDAEVARAACRSTAETDYDGGGDHWGGSMRGVTPPGAVGAGAYRLRFPTGEHGDVTVRAPVPDSEFRYFEGTGGHPLYRR